jgi:predicted CXXCH cytochrome family protein
VIEDDALVVQPVRVGPFADAGRWLPRAEFPHRPHRSAQCNLCHDANSVTDAATVMMPGIGVCRGCHGGLEPAAGRLASPCSSCHDYHREVPGDRATARAGAIPEGGDPS